MSAELIDVHGFQVILFPTQHDIATVRYVIRAGSMLEDKEAGEWGVAHFLEHMFFKGTEKRSYEEINLALGKLGRVNAYTSNQKTVYHINCLPKNIKQATEVLSEMVFLPSFPEDELQKERGTILEEWQTYQDDPGGYFSQIFGLQFGGDILHPVLGTQDSIQNIEREHVLGFRQKHYNKSSLMLAVVGKFDRSQVIKDLEEILSEHSDFSEGEITELEDFDINFDAFAFNHKSDQAMLEMFYPDFSSAEKIEINFATKLFNNAVGGGMHSMMFDRIREKKGLVYSTGVYAWGVPQHNVWCPYAITSADKVSECVDEIKGILNDVAQDGLDSNLFETARESLLFDVASGNQNVSTVAARTVDGWFESRRLIGNRFFTTEEFAEKIEKVTNEDMRMIAEKYINGPCKVMVMNGEVPVEC